MKNIHLFAFLLTFCRKIMVLNMKRIITLSFFVIVSCIVYADEKPNCDIDKGSIDASCDCSGSKNEMELSFCLAAKRDDSDKKLNKLYSSLMKRLSSDSKTRLQNAQRVWLKFRDAECMYVNGPAPDMGSGWNSAQAVCINEVTKRRVEELEKHIACTENGCPE